MNEPRLIILQPTPYCNIDCTYCYLGHRDDRRLMSGAVVAAVRDKLLARLSPDAAPAIVWHAGEPTAAPIAWYEHAYAALRPAAPAHASFAMQSNGIAIDDRWIDLFRRTGTNVSLSIDGPERFHDARRRTRNGKPTWKLAMRGLRRMQDAGYSPRVITVLHPDGLSRAEEYFAFYRDNGIGEVSFSIDEFEGANRASSFAGRDWKAEVSGFIVSVMERAYADGYPLHVREVERIAQAMAGMPMAGNEQVDPWAAIVVAADGGVSTFSPEFMEVAAPAYGNFVFGNILDGGLDDFARGEHFRRAAREIAAGLEACRSECRYFQVCGGGSPVNKFCERGRLDATETEFCRLTTQTAADALMGFLARRASALPKNIKPFDRSPLGGERYVIAN
ncbi:MAG: GRRM system radical SAM/SPASM domain protein [Alphaproteobacteria bacterium]|nr:GRRM system radical SAM/SPASM domain protein [Alphaproteobacteria bacterium]